MKKIISFSLWGDNPTYTVGAIKNADLALEIYPGWICRYYVGKSTPIDIVSSLVERENTEVFVMSEPGNWTGMFWRFYPASEPDVEVMLSRDTDSRLNLREAAAVDEWLAGDKNFHIMRDHPYHATEILGGMWGVRNGFLLGMRQAISIIIVYSMLILNMLKFVTEDISQIIFETMFGPDIRRFWP